MSEHRPTPGSQHPELAISARSLQELLEAKAREEDAKLAAELTSRRALIDFREALARKMGQVTDTYELARLIGSAVRSPIPSFSNSTNRTSSTSAWPVRISAPPMHAN